MHTRSTASRLVALCAVGALTACGTRLQDDAFVQAGTVRVAAPGDDSGFQPGESASPDDTIVGSVDGGVDNGLADPGSGPGGGPTDPGAGPTEPGSGPVTTVAAGGPPAADGPNQASDIGVTETTVKVGTIVAENGVLGDAFAPVARGIRAWLGTVNANGGIHGRKVVLVTCDDREDRTRSLECARQLVERDKVFAIVATNTRALGGASPYLAQQKIPVFGVPINNAFYRWNNFFSGYGAPYKRDGNEVGYKDQLRSLTTSYRWFKENLKLTKAAVVAYDISESSQAGDFMAKGLELEGFSVDQYTVSFAAPSFDQVVADMQRKGTEIVFDAMDDGANRRFCDTLSRRGYKLKAKVSTVVNMGQSLGSNYDADCRNVIFIPGSSAAYTMTQIPGVKAFRDAYAKYQPGQQLHQWALDGFAIGRMFEGGLAQLGAAPTRQKLIDLFNAINDPKRVTAGMLLSGSFQPADFNATRVEDCVAIARWQDSGGGWVNAAATFPVCYPDSIQYFTPVAERGD